MAYSERATEVALHIRDLIRGSQLPFEFVEYGDSEMIPKVPAVTIEPSSKNRELAGATFQTSIAMLVTLMVYHSQLDNDHERQLQADLLTEQVEDFLHQHPRMGGRVIHGFVTNVEHGYALRSDQIMRAARVIWTGQSKVRIHG